MLFWLKASWGTILWNYIEFGTVVQQEMPFKGISYLELWQPFSSAECNHLCNFIREYYKEQFCEIILKLGQWFERWCCLKYFLSGALAALLFGGVEPWGTFMWSNMKFGPGVQDVMSFKEKVYEQTQDRQKDERQASLWLRWCCFVALRPKSTAMVIAEWSVHLTTLFPGQASTSG